MSLLLSPREESVSYHRQEWRDPNARRQKRDHFVPSKMLRGGPHGSIDAYLELLVLLQLRRKRTRPVSDLLDVHLDVVVLWRRTDAERMPLHAGNGWYLHKHKLRDMQSLSASSRKRD